LAFTLNLTSKSSQIGMHSLLQAQSVNLPKEHRARLQALRGVALLEFGKGLLVLAAAISLYWVDPSDVASSFLDFLHISPDRHIAQLLLRSADTLSNQSVWFVVLIACIYSGLRFVEAYGLWNARAWAEWVALVSGMVYIPFEVYKLAHRLSLFHSSILIVNLAVVAFMFYLRIYVPRLQKVISRIR
jgi:uncharacterized membrane protein (DUF2068 family)